MSLLICSGRARPNSSTTIRGFDWEGDGSNRDYATQTLIALWWVCEKSENSAFSCIIFTALLGSLSNLAFLFMFSSVFWKNTSARKDKHKDKTAHTCFQTRTQVNVYTMCNCITDACTYRKGKHTQRNMLLHCRQTRAQTHVHTISILCGRASSTH